MIEYCGLARSREGLQTAIGEIKEIRRNFWNDLRVIGTSDSLNQSLERAGRVADFLELAELMCVDAMNREESCGGHFRLEHQTDDGEAKRDDENYAYSAAWEWTGHDDTPMLHREYLEFDYVALTQRSYK
jgi:succinate dehydrogenase / fumarate reductase flavoprotein subunit